MALESLAEMLEQARFELMRGQKWTDLRASERETRVDLARRALEESGATAEIAELRRQAGRVPDLEALSDRQTRDIASLESRLEGERAAHEARVEDLEEELRVARQERDRARARVAAVETVLDAVRDVVAAPVPAPADDDAPVAAASVPSVSLPSPAAEGGASGRRPLFRTAR